jgi:hypothetical protein
MGNWFLFNYNLRSAISTELPLTRECFIRNKYSQPTQTSEAIQPAPKMANLTGGDLPLCWNRASSSVDKCQHAVVVNATASANLSPRSSTQISVYLNLWPHDSQ